MREHTILDQRNKQSPFTNCSPRSKAQDMHLTARISKLDHTVRAAASCKFAVYACSAPGKLLADVPRCSRGRPLILVCNSDVRPHACQEPCIS